MPGKKQINGVFSNAGKIATSHMEKAQPAYSSKPEKMVPCAEQQPPKETAACRPDACFCPAALPSLKNDSNASQQQLPITRQERCCSLMEDSPEAIWVQQGDLCVYVNRRGLELLGAASQQDVVGKSLLDYIHPDFKNAAGECLPAEQSGGRAPSRELKILKMNGQAVDVEAVQSPILFRGSPALQVFIRDITKRKLAEKAMRFQANVLAHVSDAVVVADHEGRIIHWNPGAERLYEYSTTEAVGSRLEDLIPDCRIFPLPDTADGSNNQGLRRGETVHRTRSGKSLQVECSVSALSQEASGLAGVLIVIHDITARMAREKELRENEERYRSLVESSPEAIFVEQDGFCVYLNKAGHELLGIDGIEAVKQKKFLEFVRPDFREMAVDMIKSVQEPGTPSLNRELKMQRISGRELDVEAVATKITCSGKPATQIIIKDIKDQRSTELRLRLQATVLSQVNDAVVAVGRDGRIIFWNKGAERLYKVSAEEAIGKQREDIYRYRWATPEQERDARQSQETTGFLRGENIHILRSGEELCVESSVSVLTDWSYAPAGWLAVMRDVTERKIFERKLSESEERYRSLVETSPDAILVQQAGKIVYGNPSTLKLLGAADAARFTGREISDFVSPENRPVARVRLLQAEEENRELPAHETVVVRLDGAFVPVEAVGTPIRFRGDRAVQVIIKDITERKKFQEALLNSERLYRLMFESNPHPMWIYDTDTLAFLFVNDAAIAHYGYSREEFLRMTIKELRPEEDMSVLLDNVTKIAAGLHDAGSWRHRKKDGTVIDVDIISHGLKADGKDARVVMAHDITDRKKAEAALLESQLAYRTLAENLPGIVYRVVSDRKNRVHFFNRTAASLTGYDDDEIVPGRGCSLESLMLDEDRTAAVAAVRQAVEEKKQFTTEYRIRNRDGKVRYMMEQGSPIFSTDGKLLYIDGVISDITERKEAEEELKRARTDLELRVRERTSELAATVAALQSEIAERKRTAAERDKLVAAVESTAEAVVVTDRTGIIQYVNPAFEQITGFKRHEAIGNDVHIFDSGHHDQDFFKRMRETIAAQGVWKGRIVNKKKDGTTYYEDCTYSPVKDRSGNIVNYVSIKHDVTEKLRLESIAETVDTMNNIGYVFSGIRHEIGNPVSSLLIIMNLIKKKYDTGPKEAIKEYVCQAIAQVERLEYLLTSLKNFNMYENLQIRSTPLVSFLQKFKSLVTADLAKKGIDLQMMEAVSEDWIVSIDARAFQQALLNIVVNASDAVAGRPNPRISITVSRSGGMVQIGVADNGAGIPDDRKKDLFKPFYTTKANGTGLGLIITRKLISRMKGYIELTSRKDEGTVVNIHLPEGTIEPSSHET